jgi:hypothetical protein
MNSSTVQINESLIIDVKISEEVLTASLSDGRVIKVPISWYPRLSHALPRHRNVWELIGRGHGIHWPELDIDISVENILLGQSSGESGRSFKKWKQWYKQKIADEQ